MTADQTTGDNGPYRDNQADPIKGPGAVFYRCPKCSVESYFSCPNCKTEDSFTLEEGGARCKCDCLVQWAKCGNCDTNVAPKFFFQHKDTEAAKEAKVKAQGEATKNTVVTWIVGIALLVGGYYGLKSCLCNGEEEKPKPAAKAPPAKTAPVKKPKPAASVDCKTLVEDVAFLHGVYQRVRARGYRPIKKNCDAITKEVNGRIGSDWHKSRRVTPTAEAGEPPIMDAARTFGVSGTEIVLSFACDGPRKLRRQHGADVVAAYDRDFNRYSNNLKLFCSGGNPAAEERKKFDDKRGNNAEAASTAEGLLKVLGKQAKNLDIFVKLQGDEAGFSKGMPLSGYRSSVNDCRMMVVANQLAWAATSEDTKKDLVAQFVNVLKKLYPSCLPYVLVNNGARDVAVGSWSA